MTKREQDQQRIIGSQKNQIKDLKKSLGKTKNGRTYYGELSEGLKLTIEAERESNKRRVFAWFMLFAISNALWLLTYVL